jgi:hypothetical protein
MKALTLHRPWPYAVLYLGMDVINAQQPCPLSPDQYLALYAADDWDAQAADWIADRFGAEFSQKPDQHPTGIVAIAQFGGNIKASASLWWQGPVGWMLRDPTPIHPPVAIQRQQKLWDIPEDVVAALRLQWKEAKTAISVHSQRTAGIAIPSGSIRLYTGIGDMKGKLVAVLGTYPENRSYLLCEVLQGRDRSRTGQTFGCDPRWLKDIAPSWAETIHQPTLW